MGFDDHFSILGLGRSPGEGNGNPLQYSCPKNPHGHIYIYTYVYIHTFDNSNFSTKKKKVILAPQRTIKKNTWNQLIFDKSAKNTQATTTTKISLRNAVGKTGYPHAI